MVSHRDKVRIAGVPGGAQEPFCHSQFAALLAQGDVQKGTHELCWDSLKSLQGPRVTLEMAASLLATLEFSKIWGCSC